MKFEARMCKWVIVGYCIVAIPLLNGGILVSSGHGTAAGGADTVYLALSVLHLAISSIVLVFRSGSLGRAEGYTFVFFLLFFASGAFIGIVAPANCSRFPDAWQCSMQAGIGVQLALVSVAIATLGLFRIVGLSVVESIKVHNGDPGQEAGG